jgi:hypothetical protein
MERMVLLVLKDPLGLPDPLDMLEPLVSLF